MKSNNVDKRMWMMAVWLLSLSVMGQHQNPFGHALVPDMIADASIEKIGDTFYCYATTDGYGRGLDTSGPPVVWKSKDFLLWSFEGTYFPSAEHEKYWAPSKAVERKGKWYIYPTVNHFMHVGVADSPDGPFRLARGEDRFEKPFAAASTLIQGDDRGGIDAEVFIDEDSQAYAFWGMRHVAKLSDDMTTLGEIHTLQTRRTEYSEGPIFFKRKGIYYYLYTIGGDERYEYYYMMSRTSPLGPYETPAHDLVSTTDVSTGVFGPGHGSVFNDGDDYYFAFLEYGRRSTNRQTYVNRLEFNDDGTIRQVCVTMDGVGALRRISGHRELKPIAVKASSTRDSLKIRHNQDERCQRTEYFDAAFAIDGANGSRWMAQDVDASSWLMVDLGQPTVIYESELFFVRPTAGHAYILEGSVDGTEWEPCGGHADVQKRSPHRDLIQKAYRFLRVTITEGEKGVWEWRLLSDQKDVVWGNWQEERSMVNGEGFMVYRNPIVPADYSDLDCIRVGDDYYAISSTMQFSPGMTILHSRDFVNWEIAGHAVNDLSEISDALTWKEMDRYGRGVWAGTLRYHKGRFYVFFGTPDEGYFMTSAARAEGPWEPLTPLLKEAGWDDCTAIWDKRGKGYFVGTCFKDNYKTYIFDMAADGKSIDRASARLLNEGNGREANKLIKHGKYYYLVFSEHKDGIGRYVMAKRDKKLTGLFKEEKQLLLPCREANEPNQGGIIEGNDGRWYFLTHHGSGDWSGRVMSLLPVEWVDDWPMIGDRSQGELGTMVWEGRLPIQNSKFKIQNEKLEMQRSDEFDATQLGPQWQWNYEPRKEMFSLSERPGWLRLRAFKPLKPGVFLKAGNTLTQRSFRTPHNEVIVKLDISHTAYGLHAGLAHFASQSASLGIVNHQGQNYLEFTQNDASTGSAQDARQLGIAISSSTLWLKSVWGLDGKSTFYYSLDGIDFIEFGQYQLSWGFYRGDRIGIYCYNDVSENGFIDVDYLRADISTAQTLTVDAEQVLCRVEPLIYGAGAEDVNHEIYGGLYDQKIFGEGFEEPAFAEIKGFKAYDEQWCIVSGMTQLQTSRHGKLIYEGRQLSGGIVEVEVRMDDINAIAGLIVNVTNTTGGADAFNGYELALNARKGSFVLGKHQQNWQPISDTPMSFNPLGEWNKIRVLIDGAKLKIYLNDNLIKTYEDANSPLESGYVGLRSFGGSATFRNLKIDDKDIAFESDAPGVSGMWSPMGNATFEHDNSNPFTGRFSQKICGKAGTGIFNKGLNRWGISMEQDKPFHLSLYLKGDLANVQVALQSANGSKEYARTEIDGITEEWKRFDVMLTPNSDDPAGRFVIELAEEGCIWVDQVLLCTDSYPFRSDITDAFRQEHLTFLRYGGTMVNAREYMTRNMIGNRLERQPYYGHWYRYATNGFAIPEFVEFARLIGTEPTFAINIEDNPEDVLALLREIVPPAPDQREEPYGLKFIEIGNEECIGSPARSGYEHYVERYLTLYNAIHEVWPDLQFINAAWWRPKEVETMKYVFDSLDGKCDFWDYHPWTETPQQALNAEAGIAQMKELFLQWNPNTTMRCAILEENGNTHDMTHALAHAVMLNVVRRAGGFVPLDSPANALQPYKQNDNGWDQGQIFFSPSRVWMQPPFYAQQMAASNHQPLLVKSSLTSSAGLDYTATRNEKGDTLVLHIVNYGSSDRSLTLDLQNFDNVGSMRCIYLCGTETGENTPQNPTSICPNEKSIEPGEKITLRANSYTVVVITKNNGPTS